MTAQSSRHATVRRALGVWSIALLLLLAVTYHEVAPGGTVSIADETAPIIAADDLPEGPGTTEPGLLVVVTPLADGLLDVTEMSRFGVATTGIDIATPDVAQAGGTFAGARAEVSGLTVTADGRPVPLPEAARDGSVPTSIELDTGATTIELRYRLDGAVELSEPSSAGRALAALTPATAGVSNDFPVAFTATGPGIRNLICPNRPLAEQSCATGTLPTLSAAPDLAWRDALVLLQLDVRS